MLGYIYYIKNKVNGKMYIGKTFNLKQRLSQHYSALSSNKHHSHKLQRAYNKYGKENFFVDFKIVEIESEEELSLIEMQEIEKNDTYNNGYNETLGGDGNKNSLTFEQSILVYNICQQYEGVNRKIAKFFHCDHTVIDQLKNNSLYSNLPYEEEKLKKLIQDLQLEDINKKENYISHNNKKLSEQQCLELLSVILNCQGYDKTMCEIFNIDSKLTDRLKKGQIYKEVLNKYNNLTELDKQKLMKQTFKKYDIENKKAQRQRYCVKNPLSQEQVNYILDNKDKKTQTQIARELNISVDRVSAIIHNRSYKDLIAKYYSFKQDMPCKNPGKNLES